MGNSLKALEDQYILLTQQLSLLLAACSSQQERDQLMTLYVTCRRNYWNSINKIFHDDDPRITALIGQMREEQQKVQHCMQQLDQMAHVLDILTEAVNMGTQLASLAG
jgi:hypothetical protein